MGQAGRGRQSCKHTGWKGSGEEGTESMPLDGKLYSSEWTCNGMERKRQSEQRTKA